MKKFLFLAAILTCVCTVSLNAQRVRAINANPNESYGKTKVTTDSTLTYLDSVSIGTNEAGIVEVKVIGYAKDTAYSVTGVVKARFNKRRGTLTMGSVIEEQTIVTDAALGSATFTLVAASNKIYVRVKGKDATNITWYSIQRRFSLVYQ